MSSNPILVQIIRGDMIESFFRGAYVIMDSAGQIIDSVGDIDRPIYPRSALKPIQAIGLLECGAGEAYKLSLPEIALSCASHNGEERHIHIVNEWLERLGFDCNILECGIHASMNQETMLAFVRAGNKLTPAHNACSGKHTGFVTQALHMKVPVAGYTHLDHPVQQHTNRMIEEMIGISVTEAPKGIDGCQVPVIGMPLKNLAHGMAKMSNPIGLRPALSKSIQRIVTAIQTHPDLIAGTGRFCSAITLGTEGKILAKMGADGVFSVILPEKGWGIALKIDDGNLVAAEVAILGILTKHNLVAPHSTWDRWAHPTIKTWNKQIVGEISFVG
ncbi:MAG: asparaginase [Alphaproteobacteria bacterium]|nr:asparaginase [Alphaproteobacteria bacterium]